MSKIEKSDQLGQHASPKGVVGGLFQVADTEHSAMSAIAFASLPAPF